MPRYSIILPVYNVEKYLGECLESILRQNSTSLYEVIMVDDGSPDGSGAICDDYAACYENFRVIHIPNGGVSNARNTGIAAATGEYILFCDPDDLYDSGTLKVLDGYVGEDVDIVTFRGQHFNKTGMQNMVFSVVTPMGESGADYVRHCHEKGGYPVINTWLYAYKRSFLMNYDLHFQTELVVAEDVEFVLRTLYKAKKIVGTNDVLYLYRENEMGASKKVFPERIKMVAEVYAKWFRLFPCPTCANTYCYAYFGTAENCTRSNVGEIVRVYDKNKDILKHITGKREKFAYFLFETIGLYNGSALILAGISLRNSIKRGLGRM